MKDAVYIEADKLLKRLDNFYVGAKNFADRGSLNLAKDMLTKAGDDIDSILRLVIRDDEQNHRLEEIIKHFTELNSKIREGLKNQPAASQPTSAIKSDSEDVSTHGEEDSSKRVEQLASASDYTIIEDTGVTFDDVIGCEEIKTFINQDWIFRYNPEFQNVNIDNKPYQLFDPKSMDRGLLFYGLPGTGKTMIAKAIANRVKATFFSIDASQLLDKYKGGTVQRMKQLFEEASRYERAIIFIDEIDSILMKQTDSTEQHAKQDLNQWLALMNGINANKKYDRLMFIGTTNDPNSIAPAALRPGRFGKHYRLDIPDLKTRELLFTKGIDKDPLFKDMMGFINIQQAAKMTAGYTQADITALISRLLNLLKADIITKLADRIEKKLANPTHFSKSDFPMSQKQIDDFIGFSHKTSTDSIVKQLEHFEEEFQIKPLAGGIREHYAKIMKEGEQH
jgi:SpoVK/Ycf46/Vps4 family AAA+-type ATPase